MKYKSGLVLKISAVIVGILAVVMVALFVFGRTEGYRVAKIFEVSGNVTVVKGGIEYKPYIGMNIDEGTVIVTSSDSYVRIILDDDKYIKLESGSRMTFEELNTLGSGNTTMKLERGSVTSEVVRPLATNEEFVVNTPNVVLAVRGTFFRVGISRNKEGDTETDVYTYGGTVASNRILPNGKLIDENVLVKSGYKAKINMDDKDTIYVFDKGDGKKTKLIDIEDISDDDLIDIYFAVKNGHEMFLDIEKIEEKLASRNINIDEYTPIYDKAKKVAGINLFAPDDNKSFMDNINDFLSYIYGAPYDGSHKHMEIENTVLPTCLENGYITVTCETCEEVLHEQILEATGHSDGEAVVAHQATCTATGMLTTTCTVCGDVTKEEVIDMLEHEPMNSAVTVTCTENGVEAVVCKWCGLVFSENQVEATGHTAINGGVKGSHTVCENCGVILDTKHTYVEKQTKEATCTERGKIEYSCECGYSYIEETEATGHAEVKGGTEVAHSKCSSCGEVLNEEHTYVVNQTKEANCAEAGEEEHSCDCGYTYTSEIPKLGHTEVKGGTEAAHSKCSVCGEVLSSIHIYSTSQTIAPTCTDLGEEHHSCECGYAYSVEVSAKGHVKATDSSVSECVGCGKKMVDLSRDNFPDEAFLAYTAGYDIDNDGVLLEDEIESVRSIDVSDNTDITNLAGLEYFTSVTSINCTGLTSLNSIDATGFTNLNTLNISGTGITQIVCNSETGNANLQNLIANNCPSLNKIDISGTKTNVLNAEGSTSVTYIDATNSAFTSFDTSVFPDITTLILSGTSIKTLDVTSNGKLSLVNVSNCASLENANMSGVTNLTSINVNNCHSLKILDISNTYYGDSTQFSGLTSIEELYANDTYMGVNPLAEISTTLRVLEIENGTISSIDLSGYTALEKVSLQSAEINQAVFENVPNLESLNLSGCANLANLKISGATQLSTLNIFECSWINTLELSGLTSLNTLDVTYLSNLVNLTLEQLPVSSIDFAHCNNLEEVLLESCENVTSVDLSGKTALRKVILNCQSLKSVNFSGCTSLGGKMKFQDFPVEDLNISGCTGLDELELSTGTTLKRLDMSNTYITEVDISTHPNLEYLNVAGSSIQTLKLSGSDNITSLNVSGLTNLTSIEVQECSNLSDLNLSGCIGLHNLKLIELEAMDTIDLTGLSDLSNVDIEGLPIESIDFGGCPNLESCTIVSCDNIESVAIIDKILLTSVDLRCPNLTEINLSGCTGLTGSMRLPGSPVRMFNVSGCTGLEALELYYDQGLTNLDISNTNLTSIDISTHPDLSSLNVSGATKLTEINANGCIALQSFDLSGLTELKTLNFNQCSSMLSIDTYGLTKLENLYIDGCSNTTDINISGCTMLTSVDVSSCGSLGELSASDCTGLTNLDLSGRTSLQTLNLNGCANLKSLSLAECYMLNDLQVQNCELPCIDLSDVTGTIVNFEYANTTRHTVSTEADGVTIDIATQFPGSFNPAKATWGTGVTYDSVSNTLTIDGGIVTDTFTYSYDCGNGDSLEVTVTIN